MIMFMSVETSQSAIYKDVEIPHQSFVRGVFLRASVL